MSAPQNRHVSFANDAICCCGIRSRLYRQVQRVTDTIAACRIEQGVVVRACRGERLSAPYNRHICFAYDAIRCCGIRSRLYRQVQRVTDTIAACRIEQSVVVRALCADGLTAPQNRHVSFANDAIRCRGIRGSLYRQVQRVANAIAACRIVQGVVIRALCADGLTTPQNRHVCFADDTIRCCGIRCRLYRQVQGVADTIAACRIEQGVVVRALCADGLSAPYNRHVSLADDAVRCYGIRSRLYRQVQRVADTIAT